MLQKLESKEGIELLIHIGINTVALDGEFFEAHVKQGDKVKAGDFLVQFDKDEVSKNYDTTIMFIISNSNNYTMEIGALGLVTVKDKIMKMVK